MEDKAQIAYALWRKQTIAERQGSATLRAALTIAPLIMGGILFQWEAPGAWYLLVALPMAFAALLAIVDHANADRVPSWHDLLREHDYELWKIEQERRRR